MLQQQRNNFQRAAKHNLKHLLATLLTKKETIVAFVCITTLTLKVAHINCKEIDTKLDLLQEETARQQSHRNGRQFAVNYQKLYGQQPQHQQQLPLHQQTPARLASASEGVPAYQDLPLTSGEADGGGGAQAGLANSPPNDNQATAGTATSVDFLQTRSDLPRIRALNVKCEKNHMTVNIVFDRPFYGLVFSKGHYNDQSCVHLPPNKGQTSVNFDIHLGKCGMSSSEAALSEASLDGKQPTGLYIENTIIIQFDAQVQEIWDQARKLRCTWYDYYEKAVQFRPYNVDMLDAVTANFLGDNIQCWMQIQAGKGPWANEVSGIVKIGQTMTMVLAIKDDDNKFDMLVRNCIASDGQHSPIQLVDEFGCVARPKIMGKFNKVRNFGTSATVASYAHFQAFKFPDSMSVHFQCTIQVCRGQCPEPICQSAGGSSGDVIGGSGGGAIGPGSGGGGAVVETAPDVSASSASAAGDYAAVGSELVPFKERPPAPNQRVRLDEHQDRVQVHLDTSMLAPAASTSTRSSLVGHSGNGPLPPHLLHAQRNAGVGNQLSHRQDIITPRTRHNRPAYAPPQQSIGRQTLVNGRMPVVSNAYVTVPQSLAARSGELALPDAGGRPRRRKRSTAHARQLEQLLDLLTTPTSVGESNNNSNAQKSTTVQTQRTIQVVSPDDVAFSLLEGAPSESAPVVTSRQATVTDSNADVSSNNAQKQHKQQQQQHSSSIVRDSDKLVCVSARNVIFAVSLTAFAVFVSLALASLMLARRRLKRRQLVGSTTSSFSQCNLATASSANDDDDGDDRDDVSIAAITREQPIININNNHQSYNNNNNNNDDDDGRLRTVCSQFEPANFWPPSKQLAQRTIN